MRLPRLIPVALVALAAGFIACGGGDGGASPPASTEAGARNLLASFFDLAQEADGQAYCSDERVFGSEMCKRHWDVAGGPEAVPSERPTVLRARFETGLVALRICGRDGLGDQYTADFIVEGDGEDVAVPLPVFWGGRTFSGTYEEGDEPDTGASTGTTQSTGCP